MLGAPRRESSASVEKKYPGAFHPLTCRGAGGTQRFQAREGLPHTQV